MQPIREIGRGAGHPYGAPAGPYHQLYYGRGLVQLTWLANYEKADKRLHELGVLKADESLVQTPDLALRPDVAAAVMIHGMIEGWFTGRKLGDFFHGSVSDWFDARTIINGHDHAGEIAAWGMQFYSALVAQKNAPVVAPANAAGIKSVYVLGDSIAHGTAAAMGWPGNYQDGRSYAAIGATTDIPTSDGLVISMGTNPAQKTSADWLAFPKAFAQLRKRVPATTHVCWIAPAPKYAHERQFVLDFAKQNGDCCVEVVPGPDGTHPPTGTAYRTLGHQALAAMTAAAQAATPPEAA